MQLLRTTKGNVLESLAALAGTMYYIHMLGPIPKERITSSRDPCRVLPGICICMKLKFVTFEKGELNTETMSNKAS